jgi:arylsulfatase A-like enzyme
VSVVLIIADSVRQDAFGCTRASSELLPKSPFALECVPATPTVDRLASEGTVFERVITAAPWTVPSLASMLTGVYAHRLGLVKWEQPWPAETVSLFELAKRAGYAVGSFVFDPKYLFCRVPEAAVAGSSQDTQAVLQWVKDHKGKPFFLVIHYWWTHIPYIARPMDTLGWRTVSDQVLAVLRAGPDARAGVQRLYAHAVEQFSEQWLPQLLDAIDVDETWIALTADHGESWGERSPDCPPGNVFDLHGNDLYDEVLRIPLLLRPPGGMPERRISKLVRSVDLMPTLQGLLGWRSELDRGELDGVDLSRAVRGECEVPDLDALSVRNYDFLTQTELPKLPRDLYAAMALTTEDKRQVWEPGSNRRVAFDLANDPGETRDIAAHSTDELEQGWQRLQNEFDRAIVGQCLEQDMQALQGRLRSWGYVD